MTKIEDKVKLELFSRKRGRESSLMFCKYTRPDFIVNWHHEVVGNYLDLFLSKKIKNLMIFMPPQTGKSEMSTRRFPALALGQNPNNRIAICAYNQTFASKFNRDIKRIIQSPRYEALFPNTKLNRKNVSTNDKENYVKNALEFDIVGYTGFLKTTGVGGPLTGTSVDIGIIDDPIKDRLEANSLTYRERLWDWYNDVFKSRLHNDSQQLITLTRWHEDDLAGRILVEEPNEWAVLVLPALNEDGPSDIDPRQKDEALWPDKHSTERYLKIKAKNPRSYASLYQQRPAPLEGSIVKRSSFLIKKLWEIPPEVLQKHRNFVADTAYTENTSNDPSGLLDYIVHDDILYIFKFETVRKEFSEAVEWLSKCVNDRGDPLMSLVYIEPKASGKSISQFLRKKTPIRAVEYEMPTGDKEQRLYLCEPSITGGKVILIEGLWNKPFLDEICIFPNGGNDEAIDCLTMSVIQGLLRLNGKKIRKPRRLKRI